MAALDSARPAGSYSIQGWFTEHGLPSNKIRAFTQTRDGYLWIATAQGIARFDGSRFTIFSRSTNPELRGGGFFAVLEAPDGLLWFGGDNGLFCWRGGHFDHFTVKDGLADNYVRGLALARDGSIVACTRSGFSFMRNGHISTPAGIWSQISGVARSYQERHDGSRWLGSSDGLWRISGEAIEQVAGTAESPGGAFDSLLETSDGSLWIGCDRGLRRIHPDGRVEDFGTAEGMDDPRISALGTDRNGNIWIGTYGGGLYRLAHGRCEAANYTEQFGVTPIRQIYEDREGGLWIATATGLFRLKDTVSTEIGLAQGLEQTSVYSVLEASDGAWWIGLWGGGAYRYDQTRAVPLAGASELGLDQVVALAEEPPGVLWIGAMTGLYRHSNGTTTNLYRRELAGTWLKNLAEHPQNTLPGLAHRRVNSIAGDGAGGLWIATDGGLYQGKEGSFRFYTKTDGLPGNNLKSVIRARNGDIWIAAPPDGVACLHAGRWTNYPCGTVISDISPRALYEDRGGDIWVTTEGGGLNRLRGGRWRNFTARDGLADDFISGLTEDGRGNFWIACPGGIMRIPREQFDELDAGRRASLQPRIFNRFDGLPAAESNHAGSPSAWHARDGRLLFATDRGVAVIEPDRVKSDSQLPPTYIERVALGGADAELSHPLVVPPGDNDLQIRYTAISLLAAEKIRFKIRLEPLDRSWVDAGNRRDVRYAKLPPGDYTFHVVACNSDGIWDKQGVSLGFAVRPFIYQTAWFRALLVLLIASAVFGVYRVRLRRARRQMARLEAEVGARTRELRLAKEAAEAVLASRNEVIAALKRAETERESLYRQLLETSRQAGMAEVATGVLHNVGNVLNSVNVSAGVVAEQLQQSSVMNLARAAAMLRDHAATLGDFLTKDPKGKQLPFFLTELSDQLTREKTQALQELAELQRNIDHIKKIVTMQQSHARVVGVIERVKPAELVEDALRINQDDLIRDQIELVREFAANLPEVSTDRHRAVQILINLIGNARNACLDSEAAEKRVVVRIANISGRIQISVEDNGVGILPENLSRVFNHGFTTRKEGHGFGLHNGALAARELGGDLRVHSDGPGRGAVFTLELPLQPAGQQ